MDEFGPIEVRPCAGQNWCPKKHPDRQPATYTRKHGVRHLIAAYDLKEDKMYGTLQKRKTNKEFLQFLKQLRRKYDSKITLFIVCDNYGPHKTENVVVWAAKNNIEFYYTPTNASWLNRIEPQFNPLKSDVLRNSNYSNHDDIGDAIHKWFFFRNSKRYRDFVPSSRKQLC